MLHNILHALATVHRETNLKAFGKLPLDVQIMFIVAENFMQAYVGESTLVFLSSAVLCMLQ